MWITRKMKIIVPRIPIFREDQDVEPALREARKLKDRTVFMDFRTDPTENVFPMVKAGKGITEMLLGSEDL